MQKLCRRFAILGLFLAFAGMTGCAALDAMDPAHAAHKESVTIPPGAPANPAQGLPANPTTQPITVVVNVPANVPAQVAGAIRDTASNPAVQAVVAPFPYGETILSIIAGAAAIAAGVFGRNSAKQGAQIATLQSATDTSTPEDAVAASHAAITAAPQAVADYAADAKKS